MKKNIFALGMIVVATFSLTNCTKEIENPVNEQPSIKEGTPFELFVSTVETKTANSGLDTRWVENDGINVFHAVSGTTSYVNDEEFNIASADLLTGRFEGTLASEPTEGSTYDWYAIYPYNSHTTSIVNTAPDGGRYYFGKRSDQAQVQTGNNSTSHLAGTNFPMFGKASGVAYNSVPSIALSHIASFVEIKVTNKKTEPLTVTNVSLTAPSGTSLVGQYTIDFSTDPFTYTDYSTYTSNVANLTVNSGTALEKDQSATFYLGIKPVKFEGTTAAPIKLTVTVNGVSKDITLKKTVTFASGTMKTINYDFDQEDQVYQLVETDGAFVDGGKYVLALQDGATPTKYYFLTNAGTTETLTTSGLTVSDGKITNPSSEFIFTAEAESSLFKFKNSNGNYIYNSGSNTTLNTDNQTASSWYTSFISDSKTYKLQRGAATGRFIGANAANASKAMAYAIANFKDQVKDNSAIAQYSGAFSVFKLGGLVVTQEPVINNTSVSDASARGGVDLTKDIVLSSFDAVPSLTVTPDGTVVTSASVGSITTTSATVTYTLASNYSGSAREGTITVSDGAGHDGTITISQLADVFTVSRTSIELNANSGATATFTVTSDFDWTIDDSSLNGFTVSPNSFSYTDDQKQTVTITATGNNTSASSVDLDIFCVTRTADSKNYDIIVSQKSAKLAAPTLTLTPDAANKKFTVSWSSVANASKYEYYVLDGNADEKVAVTQTQDASTTSFEVTNINYDEEYTISVKAIGDNNPWIDSDEADDTITVTATSTKEEISGTFTYANSMLSLTTESGITIVQEKGTGSNNVSESYNTATTLRVYVGHTLTFSGKTITKIEFTHTNSYKGSDGISANTGTYTQGSTSSTWSGESDNVVITNSGGNTTRQLRPTKIVVYYK